MFRRATATDESVMNLTSKFFLGKEFDHRIDYVLVYKQSSDQDGIIGRKRVEYLNKLEKMGLVLGHEVNPKNDFSYILVHTPLTLLCAKAEEHQIETTYYKNDNLRILGEHPELDYSDQNIYLPFSRKVWQRSSNVAVDENLFQGIQISEMTLMYLRSGEVSAETEYKHELEYLKEKGAFCDMFCLHETLNVGETANMRKFLEENWVQNKNFMATPPINTIRAYFGNAIAVYFWWIGVYIKCLVPLSILGIFVYVFGVFTTFSAFNLPSTDVCFNRSKEAYLYCPSVMKDCYMYMLSNITDNIASVFFSFCICFFAIACPIILKYKVSSLQKKWQRSTSEIMSEQILPKFTESVLNIVSQMHLSHNQIYSELEQTTNKRSLLGKVIILVNVVYFVVFALIEYTLLVLLNKLLSRHVDSYISQILSQVLVVIMVLVCFFISYWIYCKISYFLTLWENHPTQTEFEKSYASKKANYYIMGYFFPIIMACLLFERFYHISPITRKIFSLINYTCAYLPYGYFIILSKTILLTFIALGVNSFVTSLVPKLFRRVKTRRVKIDSSHEMNTVDRIELCGQLLESYDGISQEYQEIVCQIAVVILFSTFCPLAPLLALIFNIREIRSDASKLLFDYRKPTFQNTEVSVVWTNLLDILVQLSILSNAFILAFNTDIFPKLVYIFKFSPNYSLHGYLELTLLQKDENNNPVCYNIDGKSTEMAAFYSSLMFYRIMFIFIFENFMMLMKLIFEFLFESSSGNHMKILKRNTIMMEMTKNSVSKYVAPLIS